MIGKLLTGIFNIVISLVIVLMAPIDALITSSMPSVAGNLDAFNSLVDYIINVIGYCVNASGLSDISITLIVGYWSFVILGTFSISVVKLALKWYNTLKP